MSVQDAEQHRLAFQNAWREAMEHVTLEFLRLDASLRTLQAEKEELETSTRRLLEERASQGRSRSNSRLRPDSDDEHSNSRNSQGPVLPPEEVSQIPLGAKLPRVRVPSPGNLFNGSNASRVVCPRTVELELKMFGEDAEKSPAARSASKEASRKTTSERPKRIRIPGTPRLESVSSGHPLELTPSGGAASWSRKSTRISSIGNRARQLISPSISASGIEYSEASSALSEGTIGPRTSFRSDLSSETIPSNNRKAEEEAERSLPDLLARRDSKLSSSLSRASRRATRSRGGGIDGSTPGGASNYAQSHGVTMLDNSSPLHVIRHRPSEFSTVTGETFNVLAVEVLKCWDRNETDKKVFRRFNRKALSMESRKLDEGDAENKEVPWLQACLRSMVLHPSSFWSLLWEAIGAIVIFWDIFMLPLDVFEPGRTNFLTLTEHIARFFWTASIPRSFLVGYMRPDGDFELNLEKVWRHYLTRWFAFDFVVVAIDWYTYIIVEGMQMLSAMRIARAGRFLRLLRVIRVARMLNSSSSLGALSEYLHLEKVTVIMNIFKVTVAFTVLVHISACIWYALTRLHQHDRWTWAKEFGVEDSSVGERYAISAHWAVSQFIGTMEVFPQNTTERAYSTGVLVINFILTAAFVSRVTAAMTQLHILTEGRHQQLMVLRQFLNNHKISKKLTLRVVRSARTAQALQGKNILEKDIDLLRHISRPLAAEVHYELFSTQIAHHPFFRFIQASSPPMARKFCHMAIESIPVQGGDVIFTAGEAPKVPRMFFVQGGLLRYSSAHVEASLTPSMWASEAVLWIHWYHVGELSAEDDSTLLALQSEAFQAVVMEFRGDTGFVYSYAEAYTRLVNEDVVDFADVTTDDMDRAEACVTLAHRNSRMK